MKFEEKLILLRKKKQLSQEQLAEKLNVTRQTVSKWELGQSKPDMEKLTAISKLFEVNIDILTDENKVLDDNFQTKESPKRIGDIKIKRKGVLYILIVILIVSCVALTINITTQIKNRQETLKQQEIAKQEEAKRLREEEEKQRKRESFNAVLTFFSGSQMKESVSLALDRVITNNKTNSENLIEVTYNGTSYGTDGNEIKNIKSLLKTFDGFDMVKYEVSYEYNDEGYINKMNIEDL